MPTAPKANKYLRAIFAAAREKGVTYEQLHETIWISWEKRSLKDLTGEQARLLIDGLRGKVHEASERPSRAFSYGRRHAMNAHGRKDYDRRGDAEYLVNERELQMLRGAAALRKWDERTLQNFIRRQLGRETIRTMADFNKVFWPIKSMNRRDGLDVLERA